MKLVKAYKDGVEYLFDEYWEGWKPGENTLLYLPMNSDLLDHSGNSVGVTNKSVSLNTSIISGKGVGYFSGSGHLDYILDDMDHDYIVSVWLKSNENPGTNVRVFYSIGTTKPIWMGGTGSKLTWSYGTGTDLASNENVLDQQRHLVSFVYNKSEGEGYIYVDGVQKTSGTSYPYTVNAEGQSIGYFIFAPTASVNFYRGYASELIVENKVRTAQEITDYYNLTKKNYGL